MGRVGAILGVDESSEGDEGVLFSVDDEDVGRILVFIDGIVFGVEGFPVGDDDGVIASAKGEANQDVDHFLGDDFPDGAVDSVFVDTCVMDDATCLSVTVSSDSDCSKFIFVFGGTEGG